MGGTWAQASSASPGPWKHRAVLVPASPSLGSGRGGGLRAHPNPHSHPGQTSELPSQWHSGPGGRVQAPLGGAAAAVFTVRGQQGSVVCNTPLCPCSTPAPARASLHPLPEPESSAGLAQEVSRAPRGLGTGACHTHACQCHRARVAACKEQPGRPGSRPWCQPRPHPPCHWAPPPRNCSNRPHCLLIAIATAAHELLGGGERPAGQAGGRPEGHLVTGRQHRFSPTWASH